MVVGVVGLVMAAVAPAVRETGRRQGGRSREWVLLGSCRRRGGDDQPVVTEGDGVQAVRR